MKPFMRPLAAVLVASKKIREQDSVTFNVGMLTLATAIGVVFGYLYQLAVVRQLGVEDYGMVGALLAIYSIAIQPASYYEFSVSGMVARAQSAALDPYPRLMALIVESAVVLTLALAPFLLALKPLVSLLKVSEAGLALVLLSAVAYVLLSLLRGCLQGYHRFAPYAVNRSLEKVISFFAVLILLGVGLSSNGAIMAILAANLLMLLLALPELYRLRGASRGMAPASVSLGQALRLRTVREVLAGSVPLVLVLVAVGLLTNVDVIVANRYLPEETAGLYASMVLISKLVFFVALSYVRVLYPKLIALHQGRQEETSQPAHRLVLQAVAVVCLSTMVGLAVTAPAGHMLLAIVFGPEYRGASPWLPFHVLYVGMVSVSTLLLWVKLVVKQLDLIMVAVFLSLAGSGVLWFTHPRVEMVLATLLVIGSILTSVSVFSILYGHNWRRTWYRPVPPAGSHVGGAR